jgi:hypothetical protein
MSLLCYRRHRFPAEIIQHAIWLYLRFTLSYRDVEELCGHSFSASSISAINQRLDEALAQFAGRPLGEAFPYLILDARYERVREAGVISSQAALIAIGIDWDGRRQVLASSSPTARAARAGATFCWD